MRCDILRVDLDLKSIRTPRPRAVLFGTLVVFILGGANPRATQFSESAPPSAGGVKVSAETRRLGDEDMTLTRLYMSADYNGIAKRYRSVDRVRKLSQEGRTLLVNVMLQEHAGDLLQSLTPILSDDELAIVALVAAIRGRAPVALDDVAVRRLNRTNTGRMAFSLNTHTLPPAPRALVALRDARLAVIDQFFFKDASPDARADALQALVTLTTDAFKEGRFSPDVPPPPATFTPKDLTHFALKLAVLPYLDNPDAFIASFDAAINGAVYGASR